MAALPQPQSPVVSAIYDYWANRADPPRLYLGGSAIGRECEREQWLSFRHCGVGARWEGRMQRLFNRGHREEPVFVEELRAIGVTVHDVDPSTGNQFRFKLLGGHFAGGIDGVAKGVPGAEKTWHLLEFKTHSSKSFASLQKDGVEKSKPEHYGQMQVYMRMASLERALYLAVNKDNDELYAERIKHDAAASQRLVEKAERIIFATEPPARLSEDAAFWKCKGCAFASGCHGDKLPTPNCRNCLHSTPEREGDGRWSCARWKSDIPADAQAAGCPEHRFIPALLSRWGAVEDASAEENWVSYRAPDGLVFRNGAWGEQSYSSKELAAIGPMVLRDPEMVAIRAKHVGQFVEREKFGEAA